MVARKFLVHHNDSQFDLDYDTEDGLEVLKFQLFSLTSVLPDEQKIIGGENLIITEDTDLNSVADNLRLISIQDGDQQESSVIRIEAKDEQVNSSIPVERLEDEVAIECSIPIGDPTSVAQSQSDEELARMLQAEEEALYLQQFHARSDSRHEFEQRIRPYISQVLLYEDPVRQEAARKTVPVEELEEKALVSLAKAWEDIRNTVRECQVFIANLLSSLHPRDVYYASLREYDQQGGCYLIDFIDIFKFLNSITYNIGNFFPIFGDESNDATH